MKNQNTMMNRQAVLPKLNKTKFFKHVKFMLSIENFLKPKNAKKYTRT